MRLRAIFASLLLTTCVSACEPTGGGNVPLAVDHDGVTAMAVDAFNVYWIAPTGRVRRVSLDGGPVQDLASGASAPRSIALDADNVYWSAGDGTIARVPKNGGDVTVIAQAVAVDNLVVDDKNVYFTAGDLIESVPKDASAAPITLASSEVHPSGLQLRSTLVWASAGTVAAQTGAIREMSTQGGTPGTILGQINPDKLSVAPSRLVWAESGSSSATLRAAFADGSEPHDITTLPSTFGTVDSLLADDQLLYFTTLGDGDQPGTMSVVSLAAGAVPQVMVTGPAGNHFALASDATYVYMANGGDGAILAIPKPSPDSLVGDGNAEGQQCGGSSVCPAGFACVLDGSNGGACRKTPS